MPRPHKASVSLKTRAGAGGIALASLAAASTCTAVPPQPGALSAGAPIFAPERFFAGKTEGDGVLKIVGHRRRAVHVEGLGRVDSHGRVVLSQSVREGGKAPRLRQWSIQQVSPGRYTGSLSDAAGPVVGEVVGNLLHARFRMHGGLAAEQWLYLQPGRQIAINRLVVRKLGIVVAVLHETIRKLD